MQGNCYNQKKIVNGTFPIIPTPAPVYNAFKVILTFNKGEKFLMLDSVPLDVNLQGKQQGEQEFVHLVQAPGSILIDLVGHVFDDIGNSFASNRALDRPGVEHI